MLGAQVRRCAPGGFSSRPDHRNAMMGPVVKKAAEAALARRGVAPDFRAAVFGGASGRA